MNLTNCWGENSGFFGLQKKNIKTKNNMAMDLENFVATLAREESMLLDDTIKYYVLIHRYVY